MFYVVVTIACVDLVMKEILLDKHQLGSVYGLIFFVLQYFFPKIIFSRLAQGKYHNINHVAFMLLVCI